MAYISSQEVSAIRSELKANYPGFRFSVRTLHHSKVQVRIMASPIDFSDILENSGHTSINHYYPEHAGRHEDLFRDIVRIIKTAPAKAEGGRAWHDDSDIQTDYFNTAFYFEIGVGQWDKPYQMKQ